MPKSRISRNFGLVGIAIGAIWMTFWLLDYKYNFFHLPSVEQVQHMPNGYSAPWSYQLLNSMVYWFVPGIWLSVFAIDSGPFLAVAIWVAAVLLNFPIYYLLGMAVSVATGRLRKQHAGT
jgi:hypothetical protein